MRTLMQHFAEIRSGGTLAAEDGRQECRPSYSSRNAPAALIPRPRHAGYSAAAALINRAIAPARAKTSHFIENKIVQPNARTLITFIRSTASAGPNTHATSSAA